MRETIAYSHEIGNVKMQVQVKPTFADYGKTIFGTLTILSECSEVYVFRWGTIRSISNSADRMILKTMPLSRCSLTNDKNFQNLISDN